MFTGKELVLSAIKPFVYASDITSINDYSFEYVDKEGEIRTCEYDSLPNGQGDIVKLIIDGKYSKVPSWHYTINCSNLVQRVCTKDEKIRKYWESIIGTYISEDNEVWPKIDLARN